MEELLSCEKCGKLILDGRPYVSITKNIEQMEFSFIDNEEQVVIIHSEVLITFCGSCGNEFNSDALVKLIGIIPGGTGGRNN